MFNQNICTIKELKKLFPSSEITLNSLNELIFAKTDQKYVIVDMVKDLNKQLLANILYINEINDFLYKN